MPNFTVYLNDDEAEWVADQGESRSGVIREAIAAYRREIGYEPTDDE